jgi:hypothetical protein
MHVEGVRVTHDWVVEVVDAMGDEQFTPEVLADMAILSYVVRDISFSEIHESIPAETLSHALVTLINAFGKLDEVQQGWFMSVMVAGDLMDPIRAIVFQNDDPLPKMVLLLRLMDLPDGSEILENSMLTSSLRSGDEQIRLLAEWVEQRAEMRVEEEIEQREAVNPPEGGG